MATATTTQPEQQRRDDASGALDRLAALSRQCPSLQEYYRASLRMIAEHFAAPFGAIYISNGAATFEDSAELATNAQATWRKVTQVGLVEAQSSGKALARLYTIDGTDKSVAVLAVPIQMAEQAAYGAVALVTPCDSRSDAERYLFEIESIVAFFSASVPSDTSGGSQQSVADQPLQRALKKASESSGLTELAFALTNALKSKFACNQVVLGLARNKMVKIVSISEMDDVYPRSRGSRQISQAMEECLDAQEIIYVSSGSAANSQQADVDYRLHVQWSAAIGNATVASIPLCLDDRVIGVLSMTRSKGAEISAEERASISTAVNAYAPALYLVSKSSRTLPSHAIDSATAVLRGLLEPGRIGRKIGLVLLFAFLIWFGYAEVPYRVSATCAISANRLQNLTAPFQGVIAEAPVAVGDRVVQGQLLYRMETESIELQQQELESEAAVAELEAAQAVADEDVATAAIANAKRDVIQAKLDTLQHQLQVAIVRAPCGGIVVAGDVATRVGELVPLGETLVQFVPQESRRIDLHIPEHQVLHIRPGATGSFATLARPGEFLPFTIERIEPAAQLIEQDNVFIATATLDQMPSWMKFGMQGAATVEAGRKKVRWVALHRIIDFIRLHSGL